MPVVKSSQRKLILIAFGCLVLISLQYFPEVLQFDRKRIFAGEIWRIWTGHLTHFNQSHFILNVIAAIALYFLVLGTFKPIELLAQGAIFSVLISLIFLLFIPRLDWYVGASGLLHSMTAYCAMERALSSNHKYWILFLLLWLKIAVELNFETSWLSGMLVIKEAHLIGAIIGSVGLLLLRATNYVKSQVAISDE